jgi:protocatechuate 3,4-dioxygenase beta subunit
MTRQQMQRREFLGLGAAALGILALPRFARGQSCPTPTTTDRYGYGPYYLGNAPERDFLTPLAPGAPGQAIFIRAKASDCSGPIQGVIAEVWHATSQGCYIHPSMPSCDDRGDPEKSRHWGTRVSDANGYLSFSTIKPGVYLNGSSYRPSHIHFRIRTPPGLTPQTDLVTQLYFQGDPYIPGDYGADDPGAASRIIPLSLADGGLVGDFNIVLPQTTLGLRKKDPFEDPASGAFDALVRRFGDRFLVFLPPVPAGISVEAELFDPTGKRFARSRHLTTPIEFNASLWPRGNYLARFVWNNGRGERVETVRLSR